MQYNQTLREKVLGFMRKVQHVGAINFLNIGVMVLGMGQQLLVVSLHGAGRATDLYFLLIILPQVIVNLTGNVLNNALLPTFVAVGRSGKDVSISSLFTHYHSKVFTAAIFLMLLAGAYSVYQIGFSDAEAKTFGAQSGVLAALATATILPSILSAYHATRLNAQRKFITTMAVLMLPPLFGIILGFSLKNYGIWTFVAGQLSGVCLQLFALSRIDIVLPEKRKYSNRIETADGIGSKIILLMILGVGFQFLPVIERHFAQNAGVGAITVVALASRFGGMLSPLLAAGASMILFTDMAEKAAEKKNIEATKQLFLTLLVFQLILGLALFLAPPVIKYVLGYLISDPDVLGELGLVLPDYLMAGAMGACGLIVGKGCYVLLKDQKMQVLIAYAALAFYLIYLLKMGTALELQDLARANALFWILGVFPVAIYLSYKNQWAGLKMHMAGFVVLVLAWQLSAFFFKPA